MDSKKIHRLAGILFLALAATLSAAQSDSGFFRKLDPRFHALVRTDAPALHPRAIRPAATDRDGALRYGAIVYTREPGALRTMGVPVHSVFGEFVTVRATADQLTRMARSASVRYVDAGEIQYPMNDVTTGLTGADLIHAGRVNQTVYTGENVLICIIDTGIDWSHPDFRDPDDPFKSRILFIWDQTLTPVSGENSPSESGAGYGVEYTRAHIEGELDGTASGFVRQRDYHGHGTHIAGTAAGNGASTAGARYRGLAHRAGLIVVKAGNGSFLETDVVNALSYASQKAEALSRPVVVNMSLGSDAGPHDGTGAKSTAIDEFSLSGNGRVVVVSAGNSGAENIHLSRSVAAGGYADIFFTVPSYTPESGANNDDFDFEIWADGGAALNARMTSPGGESVTQNADGAKMNHTEDGTIYLYNYISAINGDRQIRVSVYDGIASVPPASGTWTLRISNPTAATVSFHAWLYDRILGGETVILGGGDSDYTLGNSAAEALIVGSHVSRWRWHSDSGSNMSYSGTDRSDDISEFSSIGPTRDGRQKPDVTAAGQAIGSSLSSDATFATSWILPGGWHVINQGTSMSAPVVSGAAALLLELDPSASSTRVRDWITGNAVTDMHTGSAWNVRWGYGKLDVYLSLMKAANPTADPGREICVYDQWNNNYAYHLSAETRAALRFTPSLDGTVAGLFIHTSGTVSVTDSVRFEIWSDDAGNPGEKMGKTLSRAAEDMNPNTWNYIPFHVHRERISAGQHYHVVVYHNSSGNTLGLLMENFHVSYRCKLDLGSGWLTHTYDFRIRPVIVQETDVLVAARGFLEGPYDPAIHEMRTTLFSDGVIPDVSPHPEDPRTADAIPSGVVDWALLQLRAAPEGPTLASRSVFLRGDGRLVDTDGTTHEIPVSAPEGDYHLILKHRNHLGVMSASARPLSATGASVFDFSVLSGLYGASACLLEPGVYGLFAGDANGDGQIKVDDKNDYWWIEVGRAGYWSGDFNLDGQVKVDDKNDYWWKNVGRGSQVP
ncbi:MAG TPA: hypothetical protein ENN17_12795 [bacterium]|nr:hypothetical protein [bacterium]